MSRRLGLVLIFLSSCHFFPANKIDAPTLVDASVTAVDGGLVENDAGPTLPECAPVTLKTRCKSGGDAAIVRGVARFSASGLDAGSTKPSLAVFLRHSLVLTSFEARIGGRLHATRVIPLTEQQIRDGVAPFEIDLCTHDVAMWSEENGPFNVVVMLDEQGTHDMNTATQEYPFQTPQEGEWVKMVQNINVSCYQPSVCLDVTLDCNRGTECTTFKPLEQVTCAVPACDSDHGVCTAAP